MGQKLKILHLEDVAADAQLVDIELHRAKLSFEKVDVDTRADFVLAIKNYHPDVILADHSLPSFNSLAALKILKKTGLKIPFILVTATVSEEFAVEIMMEGAADYVVKDRLKRLPGAIINAVKKAKLESERENFILSIVTSEALLKGAEKIAKMGSLDIDLITQARKWSAGMDHILGYGAGEVQQSFQTFIDRVHPDDVHQLLEKFDYAVNNLGKINLEFRVVTPGNVTRYAQSELVISRDEQGMAIRANGFIRDITEMKTAELKLSQADHELRRLFETIDEVFFSRDMINSKLIHISPACEKVYGYTEEEFLTRPELWARIIHPDDSDVLKNNNIKFSKGETVNIQYRIIHKNNGVRWVESKIIPTLDKTGLLIRLDGVTRDITQRKNSEKERKELKNLLDKATNLARIGSWEIDVAKNTLYWSEITRQIHETEARFEPDVETAINFYKEGYDRDLIVKMLTDSINLGAQIDVELQIVTAKGNTKWIRVIGESEFIGGQCARVYGSMQDIHARKKAELASMQALEERNTILESIDDAFFAVDKNWTVTYWNNTAEQVLGKSKTDVLEHNLWEIFPESIGSESYIKYHLAVKTNHAIHFEDYYPPLKKWYEISSYPSDTGLSVYFKDVTNRKGVELQLNELNESLRKHAKELAISNAALEQFAYVASHDLQEPLRMVTSFLAQLERKYNDVIDEKGRQYIFFAVDGAKRMRQIILDILDFSRVGNTGDDLEHVNINALINELMALYRRKIEEVKARIEFKNLPTLLTYKTPVRQVFQNLIGNSLKYHKPGQPPVITIAFTEDEAFYQFSIKDNGIGIDPEYFDKIFIIFQRLHNKDEYSGTGMGLAIAKKIIESLGGRIWVESKEGEGCTFYFTISKIN